MIRNRVEEFFVVFMFVDDVEQAFIGAVGPVKTFRLRYRMNF